VLLLIGREDTTQKTFGALSVEMVATATFRVPSTFITEKNDTVSIC
jgi:hypothetical protein